MANFTIDELITPITAADFQQSHYDALATVGTTTTTWKPGSVVRTIIAVVCVCLGALSTLVSNIARSGFLALSNGLWARLHARYTYSVEADDANFAAGLVLVSNALGGVYDYAPDELEVSSSLTNKSYRNTAAAHIGAGALNVSIPFQAVEAGSASSALVGEIDNIVTSAPGLSCSNPGVLVGRDDESDDLLKIRCSEKLGAFSPNGPPDAYAVAARGATRANGTNLGINRIKTQPTGRCGINVYAATPSGGIVGTVGDLSTDLGALDEAVQTQAAPLGITANVFGATDKLIDVTASVWCYNTTGLTEAQIKAAITAALEQYMSSPLTAPIGGNSAGSHGYIFAEDISAAIMRATASGVPIRAFRAVVTPAAATPIAVSEVPKLGTVTLTVTRQSPQTGAP